MAKKARDRKSTAAGNDKARKTGEIKDRDLDKVSGGLRSTGGTRKGGDPCDGGE